VPQYRIWAKSTRAMALNSSMSICIDVPVPPRGIDLAGARLGERDEVLDRLCRQRRVDRQDARRARHEPRGGEVNQRIVGEVLEEAHAPREVSGGEVDPAQTQSHIRLSASRAGKVDTACRGANHPTMQP
jgi:hypothetical protein